MEARVVDFVARFMVWGARERVLREKTEAEL
jgi:hypothetical protein